MARLKTDYVDDVITGSRKYTMTTDGDYTILTDATTYSVEGDIINAAVINGINESIMSSFSTMTLTASGWSNARRTITDSRIHVDGNYETQQVISVARGATDAQIEAFNTMGLMLISQAEGSMVIRCTDTVPTIDVPVEIRYMGWK